MTAMTMGDYDDFLGFRFIANGCVACDISVFTRYPVVFPEKTSQNMKYNAYLCILNKIKR